LFEGDLLLAFAFMAVLFLRQIFILKQANKINYAPLMLGIGAISSVVHFITHPEVTDTLLILRESFFPVLVALFLYIVMNVLHQTQETQMNRTQHEFTKALIEQITQLKEFSSELEKRMILSQQDDMKAREEVQDKFKQDIKALDAIQTNQALFVDKFNEMDEWHKNVSKAFDNFTEVQLPSLDDVVHKHIDILRVEEQDHFNKVKETLKQAVDSRCDIVDELDEMKGNLSSMKNLSEDISNAIVKHTAKELTSVNKAIERQLSGVSKSFEKQILSLKSHTESISTSLSESETRLDTIRQKSEMIMKQMVLSSSKMEELQSQNVGLHDFYATIKELMSEMEMIKADYVKSQSQLSAVAKELKLTQESELGSVKGQMQNLTVDLTGQIENSLEKLHKHYHIANEDISQSVQFLAKKAQLKKGYLE